jgi:Domain of unknown function (DUF3846)
MKTLKGIWYKTDGTFEAVEVKTRGSLEQLQEMVGGLIQIITLVPAFGPFEKPRHLIINEEGLLLNLLPNPFDHIATKGTIWEYETFYGDIVLLEGEL